MLTVCTSSTGEALATLNGLKREIGMSTTATSDDERLTDCILQASAWVEDALGYPPLVQAYEETVAGYGSLRLTLARTPILAVDRVFDATSTADATSYTSSQYRVEDADAGFLTLITDTAFSWTAESRVGLTGWTVPRSESRPWLVDYWAGWVGPDGTTSTVWGATSTSRTLPRAIERACLLKAQEWYDGMAGVTSKKVGDLAITFASGGPDAASDPTAALLKPFMRHA